MASSLSNLVDNLSKVVYQTKCKYGHVNKKCEVWNKYKDCEYCLEYTSLKDDLIEYKYLCCNKNYLKNFDENLKNRFANMYKFSNHGINKFIFCCRKVFTHMNTWMIKKN